MSASPLVVDPFAARALVRAMLLVLLAFAGLCGWQAPLAAQVDPDAATLVGRVIDAQSGQSIPNVAVAHPGSGEATVTDEVGLFRLALPAGPEYTLQLTRFGYDPTEVVIPDSARARVAVLPMEPNPVELEALSVDVERLAPIEQRLESRMRAHLGGSMGYDRARIEASGVGTALDFVRRLIPGVLECEEDPSQLCTRIRGETAQILLCINELEAYAGIYELMSIPIDQLHKAEVYDTGAQIRLYTRGYMAQHIGTNPVFVPIEFGC